jgi:hypothetical protein
MGGLRLMCCSTSVFPVDKVTAEAILLLGEFKPRPSIYDTAPAMWERDVKDDDGVTITVRATIAGDHLNLSLFPNITQPEHHRRISGGVYLEIACKVAEKCGSKIVQASNVGECIENSDRNKLLADYGAGQPMDWAAVCVGYQKAILGEVLT